MNRMAWKTARIVFAIGAAVWVAQAALAWFAVGRRSARH